MMDNKKKEMELINKRIEDLEERNITHNLMTDHTIGVLFVIVITLVLCSYLLIPNQEKEVKYYESADTFCKYNNMSYLKRNIYDTPNCVLIINDTIVKVEQIDYYNGRYYFA